MRGEQLYGLAVDDHGGAEVQLQHRLTYVFADILDVVVVIDQLELAFFQLTHDQWTIFVTSVPITDVIVHPLNQEAIIVRDTEWKIDHRVDWSMEVAKLYNFSCHILNSHLVKMRSWCSPHYC